MIRKAPELWTAAKLAHDAGDKSKALSLCRTIVELYPVSDEAGHALYYLTTGTRRPAASVGGIDAVPPARDGVIRR